MFSKDFKQLKLTFVTRSLCRKGSAFLHAKQSLVGTVCWPNQSMLVQAKVQELTISSRSVHL